LRDVAKRFGLLGVTEPLLLRLAPLIVRPSSSETEVDLPVGLRITIPPGFPSARSFAGGLYEPEVTHFVEENLEANMTFVDIGANIGYYTVIASRLVGKFGRVFAFEPDSRNYAYLQRNVEANRLRNVEIIEKAATDRNGTAPFVRDPGGAEGWVAKEERGPNRITVQTTTLDHFFKSEGWPSIHMAKMDVEGSEKSVLEGMRGVIERNPRMLLIMEFNRATLERAGSNPAALAKLLAELGYCRGKIMERRMKAFSIPDEMPRGYATYNLLLQLPETRRAPVPRSGSG